MDTATIPTAEEVIATLRAHEAELRAAGIRHLAVFGSVARGDAEADSDVDLVAELDRSQPVSLESFFDLEERLTGLLGRKVDLLTAPVEKPRLLRNITRDRRDAF
jgi:predicted nucleotidyltransferase